jgi:hypothetical protein
VLYRIIKSVSNTLLYNAVSRKRKGTGSKKHTYVKKKEFPPIYGTKGEKIESTLWKAMCTFLLTFLFTSLFFFLRLAPLFRLIGLGLGQI